MRLEYVWADLPTVQYPLAINQASLSKAYLDLICPKQIARNLLVYRPA
jgi:hypothetical protein